MKQQLGNLFGAMGVVLLLAGCAASQEQEQEQEQLTAVEAKAGGQELACYDRARDGALFKVDSHLHFQPFGGDPIAHVELMGYLERMGIEYANMYGIGQTLPYNSECSYYLDCPGTPVTPSMRNDFVNAKQSLLRTQHSTGLTLSMTFMDLSAPESIPARIKLLDHEFPGLYRWAGEVNLVKQALFANGHRPVTEAEIERWDQFMPLLKERGIPLGLHADIGNDARPTQYLHLMEKVLASYPDNRIIWLHMGLSKELSTMDPAQHAAILQDLLDRYPNLMLDLSWRVLWDQYFKYPEKRKHYVALINRNYDRFLTGTDFVASDNKDFSVYREEVEVTSAINAYLDDRAFRHVALGLNYYRLLGLEHQVAQLCSSQP